VVEPPVEVVEPESLVEDESVVVPVEATAEEESAT